MQPTKGYAQTAKKATNVSLTEALLVEAKALRIDVLQAAEAGVAKAVSDKRAGGFGERQEGPLLADCGHTNWPDPGP